MHELNKKKCLPTEVAQEIDANGADMNTLPQKVTHGSFNHYYSLHDGKVHNPLGAGSYVYKEEYIGSLLRYLGLPLSNTDQALQQISPQSTLIIHIGAQPNNSPHAGTIVVFTLAFLIAREIKKYYDDLRKTGDLLVRFLTFIDDFQVVVQLDLVDTCPVHSEGCEYDGIKYQRSQRFTNAFQAFLHDYEEIMKSASDFVGGIPYRVRNQEALMSMHSISHIVGVLVRDRERLGPELAPETGALAMRCACPHKGCGLAEKHGRLNKYTTTSSGAFVIGFYCPDHGYHSVNTSNSDEIARIEFNAPLRSLVRAFAYMIDTDESRKAARSEESTVREQVHMRVTGSDYTGMYAEQLLWRQLLLLSNPMGLDATTIRPPVIAYAPLIQDWAGSKLSKSLYVAHGAYEYLKAAGMGYLLSFDDMKKQGRDHRILFGEVEKWVEDPKKLFRPYSVEYLQQVFGERRVSTAE